MCKKINRRDGWRVRICYRINSIGYRRNKLQEEQVRQQAAKDRLQNEQVRTPQVRDMAQPYSYGQMRTGRCGVFHLFKLHSTGIFNSF